MPRLRGEGHDFFAELEGEAQSGPCNLLTILMRIGASRYDVRIGGGRGGRKSRRSKGVYSINQIQMQTRGEGVNKSENFVNIISGSSHSGGEGRCLPGMARQTMERQAANFAKLPILLPGNELGVK